MECIVKKFKCSKCCCKSHCGITGHSKSDVTFTASCCLLFGSPVSVFLNVLDASWQTSEEYVEVMEESVMQIKPNKLELASLLCSTNMDFDDTEL